MKNTDKNVILEAETSTKKVILKKQLKTCRSVDNQVSCEGSAGSF